MKNYFYLFFSSADTLSVGSPSLPLTSVGMFQESRPTPILHNPSNDIYSTSLSNTSHQEAVRSLETPTFEMLSKSAPTVGQSPEFRQMAERMHNFQIKPPQQHPAQQPPPNLLPSPTQPSMLSGMWFKSQPSPPIHLPPSQHHSPLQQQQTQQQQQQRAGGYINNPVQQPFGIVMDNPSPMHNNFIKTVNTHPPPPQQPAQHAGYISQKFAQSHPPPPAVPLSSNFGAIGQNIRPSPLPPQPQAMPPPNPLLQQFGGSVNMAHRSWSGPPPGIPDPAVESRVSHAFSIKRTFFLLFLY